MKVLVAGGAGYIGSHAIRALRQGGHEVVVYDNFSTGHEFAVRGFEVVRGSIGDRKAMQRALQGVDAVMHFAAFISVGESVVNPRLYFENNVRRALSLLDSTIDAGIRHFIFSSTAAVYGNPREVPIPEEAPLQPGNPYGITKLLVEDALRAYSAAYGLHFAALRYFNAAGADAGAETGEWHDPETHLIPNALMAAAGLRPELELFGDDYPTPDGTCVRDYIHVEDLCEAHVVALEYLAAHGQSLALNLGTGRGYSNRQVLAEVEKVTGKPLPVQQCPRRAGDSPQLIANPAKAEQLLGWKAKRSLHDMVASAWQWLQKISRQSAGSAKPASGS
jgi:UDP-glucose-4-epimerase GalE